MAKSALARAFLEHWSGRAGPSAQLESALAEAVNSARARWPELPTSPTDFVRYLAERISTRETPAAALDALHTDDLYLACACVQGHAAALTAFERYILAEVPAFLARVPATTELVDEVRQSLREALLVAPAGAMPKLAGYSGKGALGAWVRVVAVRTALASRRAGERRPSEGSEGLDALLPGGDPEITYLRQRYGSALSEAFREALGALGAKERNILRLHIVDKLNIDRIGALYGVHRATVARWLKGYQEQLLARTREALRGRLGASDAELDSIVRLARSDLDVSVRRCLGS
jgi:RNA polymerase sigma-70 factor (ECF subfamily)